MKLCKECSERVLGEDLKDFANLCDVGEIAYVWCDECARWIGVNFKGQRVHIEQDEE